MPERKNPYRVRPEANPDNRFESGRTRKECLRSGMLCSPPPAGGHRQAFLAVPRWYK